jgi:hypothetical protein
MVALGELKLSHSPSHPKLLGHQALHSFLYFYCIGDGRWVAPYIRSCIFLVFEIIHRDRGTVLGLVQIVTLIGAN